jgi:hypothetical protein
MIYKCVRLERNPFPYILLAFVPYSFLWYYFERVRHVAIHSNWSSAKVVHTQTTEISSNTKVLGPRTFTDKIANPLIMKRVLWLVLLGGATWFALWEVTSPSRASGPGLVFIVVFFALHPFGAAWMIHTILRSEKRAAKFFLLALVPYSFVWYYFERVRPGRHHA